MPFWQSADDFPYFETVLDSVIKKSDWNGNQKLCYLCPVIGGKSTTNYGGLTTSSGCTVPSIFKGWY